LSSPSDRHNDESWKWKLGGFIVGALLFIGFLADILGIRSGLFPPPLPSTGATASLPPRQEPTETAESQPSTRPPTATIKADLVRWQGTLSLTKEGRNFNNIPPSEGDASVNTLGFHAGDRVIHVHLYSAGAIWTEDSTPTKRQCSDLIASQSLGRDEKDVPARVGLALCVKTFFGNRIGFARVTEIRTESALAEAIVWE
jgi:hypothetical protein